MLSCIVQDKEFSSDIRADEKQENCFRNEVSRCFKCRRNEIFSHKKGIQEESLWYDIGGQKSVNFSLLNSTNVYWKGLKANMKL